MFFPPKAATDLSVVALAESKCRQGLRAQKSNCSIQGDLLNPFRRGAAVFGLCAGVQSEQLPVRIG
jgi:hypothetical protein